MTAGVTLRDQREAGETLRTDFEDRVLNDPELFAFALARSVCSLVMISARRSRPQRVWRMRRPVMTSFERARVRHPQDGSEIPKRGAGSVACQTGQQHTSWLAATVLQLLGGNLTNRTDRAAEIIQGWTIRLPAGARIFWLRAPWFRPEREVSRRTRGFPDTVRGGDLPTDCG